MKNFNRLCLLTICLGLIACGSKKKTQEGTATSSVTGGECSEQIIVDLEEIIENCNDEKLPEINKLSARNQYLKCEELVADFKTSYPKIDCKTKVQYQGEELTAETSAVRIKKGHEMLKDELYRSNKGACGIEVAYRLKNEIMVDHVAGTDKDSLEEQIDDHKEFLEDYPELDCTINFSEFPEMSLAHKRWKKSLFEMTDSGETRIRKTDITASLKELEAAVKTN